MMKRGALICGMALVSAVASSKQLSIEAYNPVDKREVQKPAIVPLLLCLYSDREIGTRRARPKKEEGYKPMPLNDGEPGGPKPVVPCADFKGFIRPEKVIGGMLADLHVSHRFTMPGEKNGKMRSL
jgi:hypothetical protein